MYNKLEMTFEVEDGVIYTSDDFDISTIIFGIGYKFYF